jgi:hypothetical protein
MFVHSYIIINVCTFIYHFVLYSCSSQIHIHSFFSWHLFDALVHAVDAGIVTVKSESQMPLFHLTMEDQVLFNLGIRVRHFAFVLCFYSCSIPQGDPSIDSLARSIEITWASGEFKRALSLFHSAHKISASEFRNSYSLVHLLVEYLSSAKLHHEGLLAADILVAVYPNLFQAHLSRARALCRLHLWEAAAQEVALVRRMQPALYLLSSYEQEILSMAKEAAGAPPYPGISDGGHSANAAGDVDGHATESWSTILRGLSSREYIPYVVFDAVVCSCFVALYSYMCKIKAATAKAAKSSITVAAAPLHAQAPPAPRRARA